MPGSDELDTLMRAALSWPDREPGIQVGRRVRRVLTLIEPAVRGTGRPPAPGTLDGPLRGLRAYLRRYPTGHRASVVGRVVALAESVQ